MAPTSVMAQVASPAPAVKAPATPTRPGPAAAERTAKQYDYPGARFSIALPAGEAIEERADEVTLAILSPNGYAFTLLGEPGKVPMETGEFVHEIERAFMGEGKVWSRRIGFDITTVGGVPAYNGTYEGPSMLSRLVIARGIGADFVLVFRAPPDKFKTLGPIFDGILTSFSISEDAASVPTSPLAALPAGIAEPKPAKADEPPPSASAAANGGAQPKPPTRATDFAADVDAEVETMLKYFDTIVFGAEFDAAQASKVVAKWDGPVHIEVQGKYKPSHVEYIQKHVNALAKLTGLLFSVTEGPDKAANMSIIFMPRRQMATFSIPNVDAGLVQRLGAQGGCYFISARAPGEEWRISRAVIVVNNERQEDGINHCLLEEITQSLGLPNDSDTLRPSLFSDRDQLIALSRHDEILVRTLYDYRLKPGLPREQALDVARDVIRELHRFLPPGNGR